MSAQENTRLVQQAYQSIGAGDVESFLSSVADDIRWQIPEMENVPFAGTWTGRDGVRRFFGTTAANQDPLEFAPQEFIAQGDDVVVLGHFTMRIKATGRAYSSNWAHAWTIHGGQVTRFREYVDTATVVRAHSVTRAPANAR